MLVAPCCGEGGQRVHRVGEALEGCSRIVELQFMEHRWHGCVGAQRCGDFRGHIRALQPGFVQTGCGVVDEDIQRLHLDVDERGARLGESGRDIVCCPGAAQHGDGGEGVGTFCAADSGNNAVAELAAAFGETLRGGHGNQATPQPRHRPGSSRTYVLNGKLVRICLRVVFTPWEHSLSHACLGRVWASVDVGDGHPQLARRVRRLLV